MGKISKAFKVRLRLFLENLGDCSGGCCLFFGVGVNIFIAFLLRSKKIIVNCHLSIINLLLPLLHLRADALIHLYGLRGLGGDDIMGKAFTWRFGFDPFGTSQLLMISQRQSNSRCYGICLLYSFIILYRNRGGYSVVVYIHIGVRSALLVSTNRAMRRPQKGETGNRYRFSRFSILIVYTAESGELIGTRGRTIFLIINYKFYDYAKDKTLVSHNGSAVVQRGNKCRNGGQWHVR